MSELFLISYIALWVLFIVMALVLLSVLRNMGELANAVQQFGEMKDPITLTPGKVAPVVSLVTLDGVPTSTTDLLGQQTIYAIISPGCAPCRDLLQALAEGDLLQDFSSTSGRRVLISTASQEQTATLINEVVLPRDIAILLDSSRSTATQWGARNTPTFIVLDAQGRYAQHVIGFIRQSAPLAM